MTVNALQPSAQLLGQQRYTQNDLMVDPLIVLRCDQRVYRSEHTPLYPSRGPFLCVTKGPYGPAPYKKKKASRTFQFFPFKNDSP